MNHAITIISLFAYVSLGALTLWAVKDLWAVMIVLLLITGVFALASRKG